MTMATAEYPDMVEREVAPETIWTLRELTDDLLLEKGIVEGDYDVAEFFIDGPHGYGLRIDRINDGVKGHNSVPIGTKKDDSMRWAISVDPGTDFGAAHFQIGAIHENGKFVPSGYGSWVREIIDNTPVERLLESFVGNTTRFTTWTEENGYSGQVTEVEGNEMSVDVLTAEGLRGLNDDAFMSWVIDKFRQVPETMFDHGPDGQPLAELLILQAVLHGTVPRQHPSIGKVDQPKLRAYVQELQRRAKSSSRRTWTNQE